MELLLACRVRHNIIQGARHDYSSQDFRDQPALAAAALLANGAVTSVNPAHAAGTVKCSGANSCKGTSACKTAQNPGGPGANYCKGPGPVDDEQQRRLQGGWWPGSELIGFG